MSESEREDSGPEWAFLPVSLQIEGNICLVLGTGPEARRKAILLEKAGARVIPCATESEIQVSIEHARLVVAASGNADVDLRVANLARSRRIPVNVLNQPENSTFIFPSVIDRHPVLIAISSSGNAPVLTRMLRERLEAAIPAGVGRLARFAGRIRTRVNERFRWLNQRRRFWERTLQGPVVNLFLSGREADAEALLEDQLEHDETPPMGGEVYLVGAGPGDPDLLTLRALRLMRQADVVLYDRLVSRSILDRVRGDAERIYVGKAQAEHSVPQQSINQRLVDLALAGKRVLRLKGGDPFIFGRGGEEIDQLAAHGIPFEVVPGITAASGCSTYAGIPLTHRDCAQSVRFVTAHRQEGGAALDWSRLIEPGQTLVFYMGLTSLPDIARELQAWGMEGTTPVAVISRGTQPDQKVVCSDLAGIAVAVTDAKLKAPTIIIVGDVVRLRDRLDWIRVRNVTE